MQAVFIELAAAVTDVVRTVGEPARIIAFAHDAGTEQIAVQALAPDFDARAIRRGSPPIVQLPRQELLASLREHYVVARLQSLIYSSLMVESNMRLRHMDGAVRRLDEDSERLQAQRNRLRQEEITRKIETIMLSSELDAASVAPRSRTRGVQ